jgi:hypothetical protein
MLDLALYLRTIIFSRYYRLQFMRNKYILCLKFRCWTYLGTIKFRHVAYWKKIPEYIVGPLLHFVKTFKPNLYVGKTMQLCSDTACTFLLPSCLSLILPLLFRSSFCAVYETQRRIKRSIKETETSQWQEGITNKMGSRPEPRFKIPPSYMESCKNGLQIKRRDRKMAGRC